jgi:hypothetical protein
MKKSNSISKTNNKGSILVFVLSIWFVIYWLFGHIINIYEYKAVGVVYEILWLPMLLMGLVLPIVSLIFWYKEKFNFKSFYFFAFLLVVLTILVLILSK